MALPSYVTQRDVLGDFNLENIVILESGVQDDLNYEYILLWDYLDDAAKVKFDSISDSPDLITELKNITFKNDSFWNFLSYAIRKILFEYNDNTIKRTSSVEVLNRSFVPSGDSLRVGSYSSGDALKTYNSTNVFSYTSVYGPSTKRDIITGTGSYSATGVEGKIRLSTGTTSGSSVSDYTVKRGKYIPGKASEAGIGAFVTGQPTGDAEIQLGLFDGSNGAIFVLKENEFLTRIYSDGQIIEETSQSNWNLNKGDGLSNNKGNRRITFDPFNQGYIYIIRFSWYGVGKIIFEIESPINGEPETLTSIPMHEFIPNTKDGEQSFIDPNLPIWAKVYNGTTETDVALDIGGRRFDVLGTLEPEIRTTPVLFVNTNLSERTVIGSVRKKYDFPEVGRIASISAFLRTLDVYLATNNNCRIRIYSVPRGTIGGTWSSPEEVIDSNETGLEVNETPIDLTTVPNRTIILGPILIVGKRVTTLPSSRTLRIPIINSQEFVVELEPSGGGSVDSECIFEFAEEW